jgi:DNA-directed RNA polymerase specialized sigma24 family protein
MAERDAWEQRLYRFARVLLRDEPAARALVLETLDAAAKKPAPSDFDALVTRQFQEVRRRALEAKPAATAPVATGELSGNAAAVVQRTDASALEDALNALPEPGRSALALLALDAMDADWIAKLLGLTTEDFGDTVHTARLGLCATLSAAGVPQP